MNYKTALSSLVDLKCCSHSNGDQMFLRDTLEKLLLSLRTDLIHAWLSCEACLGTSLVQQLSLPVSGYLTH